MARLDEWDFFNRNVQSGLTEGQFMAAQYTMVAAGPPNLAYLSDLDPSNDDLGVGESGSAVVFPMGVTQRFGINQTRQHARVWEIGSERSYWISGRSVGQITLGRIVYHGPNLLRSLYAYYSTAPDPETLYPFPSLMGDSPEIIAANENRNPHKISISPGHKNMFLNLASDLFAQTIGLLIYFKDSNDESVYACYAENCVIPTHSLGLDAGGTVMQENVQIQFERLQPVHLTNVLSLVDITYSGYMAGIPNKRDVSTGRNQ